ncbi:MAG TPA: hypothetical protein VNJ51_02335 [Candidatus Dormibacteraeota bacterium]|nr:hypothetical protein [Candidatus Dormibacteraeota bacterium]
MSIFVLGGGEHMLAFVTQASGEKGQLPVVMAPLAWTPVGVAIGDAWQRVLIDEDNVAGWVDQTFVPEDERAFIAPLGELELLRRVGWRDAVPERLTEEEILNLADLPEDVVDALASPMLPIARCTACRRSCVKDDFVWQERQLCAWDWHRTVFGRRGPWRSEPYNRMQFSSASAAAYVVPALAEEAGAETLMLLGRVDPDLAYDVVSTVIERVGEGSYLTVSTDTGWVLLRERA